MKRTPVLIPFLFFVAAVFIGILIFTYVETKKANPQMIQVGQTSWRTLSACRAETRPDAAPVTA